MTSTAKNSTDGRIAKHTGREFSRVNALEQFLLRGVMVNMQRVLTTTALCALTTFFAIPSLAANHFVAPLSIVNSPVVLSMVNEGMLPAGMSSDIPRYSNRGPLHYGKNVDGSIAATSADMLALVLLDPTNSFRGQTFASEVVTLNILWNAYGFAMLPSREGNRFSATAGAKNLFVSSIGEPLVDAFHVRSLALGELLEPLTGRAEGNQQPSQKYTSGRFRDYRSGLARLMTGFSARAVKFHPRHDIVRTPEKSRDNSSMTHRTRQLDSRDRVPLRRKLQCTQGELREARLARAKGNPQRSVRNGETLLTNVQRLAGEEPTNNPALAPCPLEVQG